MQGTRLRFASISLLSGLALAVMTLLVPPGGLTGDGRAYLALAQGGPSPAVPLPFACRVLTPLIVRALPVAPMTGFVIVTVASLALFAGLFDRYLRLLDRSPGEALAGTASCLGLYYPTLYSLHNPYLVDPLFFVFWIGAQIFILEDRLLPLAATLALGAVNKEALLIVAPLYAIAGPGPRARRLARAAMAAAPAAAIYAAIHLYAVRAGTPEDASKSLMEAIASFPRGERLRSLISGALLAGGPLWLSALWGARAAEPRLLRWAAVGALCTAPLVIIAADAGRMLGLLVPFWMPLALAAWRRGLAARPAWQIIAPVLIGEALLVTTVQIDARPAIENLMRVAGVALLLSPLLLSRSAAPKPDARLAAG